MIRANYDFSFTLNRIKKPNRQHSIYEKGGGRK
jgi:hypothetical protein